MSIKVLTKVKGNRFKKAKYHILFYAPAYFNPVEDEGNRNFYLGKPVKIPVRIDLGEGESRSNLTSFSVNTITRFDNNVEGVLKSLSLLDKRVIKPRGMEDTCELVKVRFKILQLICSAIASSTIQEAAKVARQGVYDWIVASC